MSFYGANLTEETPPNGAIYVSLNGDDGADGGIQTPLRSLQVALYRAPLEGHVAVYGGHFEGQSDVNQPWNKPVTISSVPGERARFFGSVEVHDWVPHAAGVWKRTGWITNFDHTPISPTMCHPDRPEAAWPEQVWCGGHQLRMTPPGAEMQAGEFWYDAPNRVMFISKDPEEGVRIAVKSVFLSGVQNSQTGNHPRLKLCGVSVEEWATQSRDIGAVRVYGHGSSVKDCIFRGCSAGGLFVQLGRGISLQHNEYRYCGQLGLHGFRVEDLDVGHSVVQENNFKGFSEEQVAGGAKVDTQSFRMNVHHNLIVNNRGHGFWNDLGSYGVVYSYNVVKGHVGASGLYAELCYGAKFLSNWLEGNTVGTLTSGTGDVEVAYNTYADNTYHTRFQREPRPDEPGTVYEHKQEGFNVHSNLYVQNIPDNNVAIQSYEAYGPRVTYEEAGWHSDRNVVTRVPGGRAAVLTTTGNVRTGIPTVSDVFVLTGEEGSSLETIAVGTHTTDSIQGLGLPMTAEVRQILGVTEAEAGEPNIGWYGREYIPDSEPEEPMTLAETLRDIADQVEILESDNANLRAEVSNLQEQLQEAEALLAIRDNDLRLAEAEISELQTVNTDLHAALAAAQTENVTLAAQITELHEQIAELEARLELCECPPASREERLAPLRGHHRWGACAKPGTLAALQNFENLIDMPVESRRIFNSGDLDWTVDTAAGRVPIVEVVLGITASDLAVMVDKAIVDDKPVVFTIGHEEERPDKNNTPQYFKDEVARIAPILHQADKAIVIVTFMNGTLRGFVKKDGVNVNIQDWLPTVEHIDGIGFDVYVAETDNLTANSIDKVCKPMLQIANQLQVPLFVPEFGVGGTEAGRAAWVTKYMQWIYGLLDGSIIYPDMTNIRELAPLISDYFHSNIGGSPPMTFDGTKGWEIHKASDKQDTQTPNVWKWGIASNGA